MDAERELRELAYAASHDLKEPLRAITGYLRLLESRYGEGLDETGRRLVAGAVEGADRMDAMISGLLEYSRASGAELQLQEVDAGALAEEAIDGLRRSGELDGATVEVGDLPTVRADPDGLRKVFTELLSNAVKFRGEATPYVTVGSDGSTFWVTDNGPGVDPAQTAKAFGVFGRLHTRGEYPGAGMGLAVARTIVEHHGGSISVSPAEGGGSRFEFSLG